MKPLPLIALLLLCTAAAATQPEAPPAGDAATVVVTTRPIRARSVIGPDDVALAKGRSTGALATVDEAIGMEARVWLQTGQAITPDDLAPAALVERNQLVTMRFRSGRLEITVEGRALDRAAAGEPVRVMNLGSRTTVTGRVVGPSLVEVN